jgi:hypothetical protein
MSTIRRIASFSFLCFVLSAHAQQTQQVQKFKFGLQFETGVAWFKSDIPETKRETPGVVLSAGLAADYYFARNYAFATGLSLLSVGGTLSYLNGTTLKTAGDTDGHVPAGGSVAYRQQYIRIPLGMKMRTQPVGRFKYYADLGFDPMARVGAKAGYTAAGGAKYDKIGANKSIRFLALGYHISGGLKYAAGGNTDLVCGLTFMNTFTDVTPQGDHISVNHLMLRIGVSF